MATARAKSRDEPRKLRWTVPAVDVSVIDWLDAQHDVSQSLRALIRESIEHDGVIDVFYKPVEKQPRRGRPPARVIDGDGDEGDDPDRDEDGDDAAFDADEPPVQDRRVRRAGAQAAKATTSTDDSGDADDDDPVSALDAAPIDTVSVPSPMPPAAPARPAADDSGSSGQASIDEIMASTRR